MNTSNDENGMPFSMVNTTTTLDGILS